MRSRTVTTEESGHSTLLVRNLLFHFQSMDFLEWLESIGFAKSSGGGGANSLYGIRRNALFAISLRP